MIYKLRPTTKDYIWGGTKLKEEYNKKSETDIIAETWELSCHKDGHSFIEGTDMRLADLLEKNPSFKGTNLEGTEEFPILIKMIDAKNNLSIQVHPNDDYAKRVENQQGKTEMWYIVDAEPGAYLYYGFNEKISPEEFEKAIQEDTLCDKLGKAYVKKGDVFFIEAGTIHAIGEGIVIAEIQQSSNVTYRVYDYGRVGVDGKPRELHVEKAKEVTNLEPARTDYDFGGHLVTCDYFTVDKEVIDGEKTYKADATSFMSIVLVSGSGEVSDKESNVEVSTGETVFIPAGTGEFTFKGQGEFLLTYIK